MKIEFNDDFDEWTKMCVECGYVGKVFDAFKKFKEDKSSNCDLLEELTVICLEYWKERTLEAED